jgi:hypothetical protein
MDERERKREARRQKALERLGTDNPRCSCGETDPHCLELHHIAGQAYGSETIIRCRNCHRKLSNLQKDHPGQQSGPPDLLERIGHFLLGIANLFELLIVKLREFGHALIDQARQQPDAMESRT